jgi:hypothetical protein
VPSWPKQEIVRRATDYLTLSCRDGVANLQGIPTDTQRAAIRLNEVLGHPLSTANLRPDVVAGALRA